MYSQILKMTAVGVLSLSLTACFDDDNDNRAPTTVSVDLTTQADTPLVDMATAADADNDVLTYSIVTQPVNGQVTLDSDGQFTYVPNATVTGSDSFVFGVTDGSSPVVNGTVGITIEALQVGFSSYSRTVFAQNEGDAPLPVNGRVFTQDVVDANAYDDLLN